MTQRPGGQRSLTAADVMRSTTIKRAGALAFGVCALHGIAAFGQSVESISVD